MGEAGADSGDEQDEQDEQEGQVRRTSVGWSTGVRSLVYVG